MMEYKGYIARIEFDAQAETFHGRVANLKDVVSFEGNSVAQLKREFRNSVDDYLELCASRGEEPERPFPGKFALRMPSELHRQVAIHAEATGTSINSFICAALESATNAPRAATPSGSPRDTGGRVADAGRRHRASKRRRAG